jgi:hypothetical protein
MSTMTRIRACPSPNNNSNHERLFLFEWPRSGLLESVKRPGSVRKHGDEGMMDAAAARVALGELLAKSGLSGAELDEANAILDQALGSGEDFVPGEDTEHEDDDEDEGTEVEGRGRSRMRQFLAERGVSDSETDELFSRMDREGMPRNAMGDRKKRLARDRRRRLASDAALDRAEASFDRMFPEAARLKMAF